MKNHTIEAVKLKQTALTYIKEIIDVLRECFLIIDSDLKVIAANELFYQTFNVKKEETEGRLIFDLGNRQWDIPELKVLFTDIIPKQGVIGDYEVRHSFETIGEKIMLLNAKQIETSQMIIVAIEDVTVKKRLEETLAKFAETQEAKIVERTAQLGGKVRELEESKARDGAILESIGDALVVVDSKGKIGFVNNVFEELLGWKQEDVLGKKMVEIVPREDEAGTILPFEERILSLVLAGKKVATTTVSAAATATTEPIVVLPAQYYIRKDKSRFLAAGIVSPIVLRDKIIGAVEIFRDITKEKEIDKAKSEFVSLASHQLRTPTTSINWYSEMLIGEEVGPLNKKQKEYCQEIHHGNQRMIELMNALLTVSRIELGTFALDPAPMNIPEVIDDVLEELNTQIIDKSLRIDKKYKSSAARIVSDSTLIRIVFQNLLSNAIGYSSKKGTVTIEVKNIDAAVSIEIKDRGCGIPIDDQPKLFAKFFRAGNARSLKPDGTGLGLYITKSIVEALDGSISFTSRKDEGATFLVTMPSQVVTQTH